MKTIYVLGLVFALSYSHIMCVNAVQPIYISRTLNGSFIEITEKVKVSLKTQGFSVISEIDMHEKLSEKLENIDMQPYLILGVCNPEYAYNSLQVEENIGVFLPCKVIIRQIDKSTHEVVFADPVMVMKVLNNPELLDISQKVKTLLQKTMDEL